MQASALATIHPGVFTVLTLASLILSASGHSPQGFVGAIIGLCGVALTLGWVTSVGVMSAGEKAKREAPILTLLCCGAVGAIGAKAMLYPPGTRNTPWDVLGLGLVIVLLWRSALALETATPGTASPSTGRILKTMALVFFSVVGVWILRPRLLQIAAAKRA